MKKWTIGLFSLTLILISSAQGGIVLGIRPSAKYGTNYIGLELSPRFSLYGGADLLQIDFREEYLGGQATASLFVPNLGFKLLLGEKELKEITPYFSLMLLKSFATLEIDDNSSLGDYLSEADEKVMEELLGFWGVSPAVGAEYPFSPKFSLGGEIGYRIFFAQGKLERARWGGYYLFSDPEINPPSNEAVIKMDMTRTYATACLNFRF